MRSGAITSRSSRKAMRKYSLLLPGAESSAVGSHVWLASGRHLHGELHKCVRRKQVPVLPLFSQ